MLTNVFDLAAPHFQFNKFGITEHSIDEQLILDTELLFEQHGMINCGRLVDIDSIDSNEYLVDPTNFLIRELYDRRMPSTHFFSIFNVKKASPIPATAISKFCMNDDDDTEYLSFMPELVAIRNRSLIVLMKLRALKFTV